MAGDDMGNNGSDRMYSDALTAQLGERVTNLGRRQSDLESEMRNGFRQIETSFQSFTNETRNAFTTISQTISERGRAPWGVLISAGVFIVTITSAVGALAYWPILSSQSKLEENQVNIVERMVTQKELEWRTARAAEERLRTDVTLRSIDNSMVPRAELDRVFQGYDQRLADHQRQIDETKSIIGNTYSLKDYIARITERLDTIEQRTLYTPRSRLTP